MLQRNILIDELLIKHLQGSLTEAEQQQLNEWLTFPANRLLFEKLTDPNHVSAGLEKLAGYDDEKGWETIKRTMPFAKPPSIKRYNWRRVAAVAAIIILGTGSYFIFFNKKEMHSETVQTMPVKDIDPPTSTKATITLSNGQTVLLDSINSGTLANQGNIKVVKLDDGHIVYSGAETAIAYNTLSNPRGSNVVNLTLQDGTKVWLNNESSIRYPIAFVGNERNVEITGEAYFEVTKHATKKFIVTGNGITTEVLGTHFNVNTYVDEHSIKVTLLEGAVKVSKGTATSLLKPGQQANITTNIEILKGINTDEVMAWKDGFFHFESADLKTILRQFARWYDIEVVYEGTLRNRKFFSIMKRQSSLGNVLKALQANEVKFRIEGKKLFVQSG